MRSNLKKARKEKGLSQQQVADKLGINKKYYQYIEDGHTNARPGDWDKLEAITGVSKEMLRKVKAVTEDDSDDEEQKSLSQKQIDEIKAEIERREQEILEIQKRDAEVREREREQKEQQKARNLRYIKFGKLAERYFQAENSSVEEFEKKLQDYQAIMRLSADLANGKADSEESREI